MLNKFVSLLAIKAYRESRSIAPRILNLGTRGLNDQFQSGIFFNFALNKLDWIVYTCLTQLYGGRDMYNLLHKEQLHVASLFIGHLQVDK